MIYAIHVESVDLCGNRTRKLAGYCENPVTLDTCGFYYVTNTPIGTDSEEVILDKIHSLIQTANSRG